MTRELATNSFATADSAPLPRGSRYLIAEGEEQATEVIRGKARVGRGVSAKYTLEVPLDYTSTDMLDVFVKGCAASEAAYAPLRRASAQLGKAGLTVGSPRGTMLGDVLSPSDFFHAERYQARAVAAAMEDVESRYGLKSANLKGHSMGGRDATEVAKMLPDHAESVTYISAAGLERHNLLVMAGRLRSFASRDAGPNFNLLREEFEDPRVLAEMAWHVLSNPLRTGIDALTISRADIRDRVLELGDKGVRVAILDMLSDRLVPNASVENTVGRWVDVYKRHPNPYFGHVAPQTHALETAWELHAIDQELFPDRVAAPREFAVRAMGRRFQEAPVASVESLSVAS